MKANCFGSGQRPPPVSHFPPPFYHSFLFPLQKKKKPNPPQTPPDTIRDNCHCRSHHLHVSPCPTPRTSALNNCPCPDAVSLCHNPLNPWTLTCFNKVHEAASFGRLNLNSLLLNSWLIGFLKFFFFKLELIWTVVYCAQRAAITSGLCADKTWQRSTSGAWGSGDKGLAMCFSSSFSPS